MTDLKATELAIQFHKTYERLAPAFGYETRTETRQFDATTPNGQLMIAVCGELLRTGQLIVAPAPTTALQEAVEALSDDDVRWVMKAVDVPIARARLVHLLRRAAVAAGDLIGENDAQ